MLKVLKWIGIAFVVLIVIGLIFGDDKQVATGQSAGAGNQSDPVVEPYKTTARELFAAYEENEVATDLQIDKRPVEIVGIVQGINKDFTDEIVIELTTSNQFMPARINLIEGHEATAASLKKGQKVTFLCEKMMRLIGSPSGSDCQPI